MGISFDLILHQLFNSLCQSVLTLEQSIHIMFNFLLEGQKLLFRMVFAILKSNNAFLLKMVSKQNTMEKLRENCLKVVNLNELQKYSFELNLRTKK